MLIITALESTDGNLYSPMQSKIHPTDPSPPQASTRKLGTSRKKLSLGDIKTMRCCLSCICMKASLGPIIKVIMWSDNTAAKQTYPTILHHSNFSPVAMYSLPLSAACLIWRMLQKICVVFKTVSWEKNSGSQTHWAAKTSKLKPFWHIASTLLIVKVWVPKFCSLFICLWTGLELWDKHSMNTTCCLSQDRKKRSRQKTSLSAGQEHVLQHMGDWGTYHAYTDTCGICYSTEHHTRAKQSHKCVKNLYCVAPFDRLWHCTMFYVCRTRAKEASKCATTFTMKTLSIQAALSFSYLLRFIAVVLWKFSNYVNNDNNILDMDVHWSSIAE